MKLYRFVLLVLAICLLQSAVFLSREDDCVSSLKQMFKKMSFTEIPKDGKTYFFDYSVKTNYRDNSSQPTNIRVKTYLSSGHVEVVSDMMEVYQDKVNTMTVVPIRKVIYWADSDLGRKDTSSSKMQNFEMGLMKEKIFDHCTLKYCKDVEGAKNYNREIALEPNSKLRKSSNINLVKFWVNTKKQTIYKTIIFNEKESPQQSIEVVYHEVDFDHTGHNLNYSSKSKIFKSEGNLVAKYVGYKVIDVRSKKK